MNYIYFLTILFGLVSKASAGELYQAGLPPRCLAMGGTCIAHIRGSQGLFFNASTLARMEGFDFTLLQATAAVSKNAESYVNAVKKNGGNKISLTDIQGLYGKTISADAAVRAGIAMPYFGMGAYSQNYLVETFNNPTFPTFNANYVSDYGYTIAAAVPFGPQTSIGIAGRSAKRWGGNKDIDISTLINSSNQSIIDQNFPDHGSGVAMDLSFITTLNTELKPTFSVVWLDVGKTQYRVYSGTQDPPAQDDNLIFGAAIQHEFLKGAWTHSFEYQYIRTNGEDLSKKIHIGSEVSYGLIDLRAGLSQGYLTYGLGLDLWFLRVEAAAFSSELGAYAGQSRNDRYQLGVTVDFDFDQTFKMLDMNGKKRRLKQRR